MNIKWDDVFDNCAVKTVSPTDKSKGAYLPNLGQKAAIHAAGLSPSAARPREEFSITVLLDEARDAVKASYYYSERTGAGRTPEPRMGHEIISAWLNVGDEVVIGNIGSQLFAVKALSKAATNAEFVKALAKGVSRGALFKRAQAAIGPAPTRMTQRTEFVRNPFVVAAALVRSENKCEAPGCSRELFVRSDGRPYLEVHHVTPLGEGGDDTLKNAAALCPHCHRELHFGVNRLVQRAALANRIASLTADST
ncbi:HNH endonuclease signature motif containing protein [Asticcacaulis sp. SL142]|uniref:HNH endonuclease n=1 Tax=Asticcacaulis sp. SL142 TaxID=2995155 RepID=UPI00226CC102|nr:HNH endonuclease signature motif containing protein [Asticcacaulis sp. SL142]WAC49803.1 HNH endonuclease signature motif containing protein [Asticcacaulis sp. SL142]